MKRISRAVLVGVGVAAAGVLAVAGPASAATAPVTATQAAADFCTASTSGSTVNGSCTLSTPLGNFGSTFSGTVQADGNASGDITLNAGIFGNQHGTWTGGPFLPGQTATVNYTVSTPVGPVSGSFQVPISG
ncbi:hypothetical protein [Labedaea rhizosphaerae]|uniref:Uncharacterized protein n=1 Tax=Labedaea rhizosphaerae TaxID=598644 RepID=A0A4R6S089_LABRH|nr:hypothetical protein [Labedaea rhizosphaerae]TDP92891.1 hypothetical protein EV186_107126 [Labedaea rhizosphaerae]